MRTKTLAVKILASTLIVIFPLTAGPALAGGATASISGTLFSAASSAPLAGAKLHLEDAATGSAYVSSPAGVDGAFDVENLPASSYRVAVESNGGLYVVDTPVKLDAGAERHVRLAVRDTGRAGSGRADSGSDVPKKNGATETSFWSNPLTATLLVVGGAILVGVIVDQATSDDEPTPASASAP